MWRAGYSRANQSPDKYENPNLCPVNEEDGSEHGKILEFINEKFKKRTCKRFVTNPYAKDSSLCYCGYPKSGSHAKKPDTNDKNADERQWDVMKDTEESPTDAFGEMEFDSAGRNIAKYIRVDYKTNVDDLLELMLGPKYWNMEMPNFLISVTGGAQNFTMEPRHMEVFQEGIVTAAESMHAWIITGGTNTGVMKHVGEAIRRHTIKHGSKKPLVALGIATWGCVENKEDLIDKTSKPTNQQEYFTGLWPASYNNTTTAGKKESPLDPNHTHFILVDNGTQHQYGAEIALRANLESTMSKMKISTAEYVSIPVVYVVLEGGPNTLETVKQAIDSGTPAIIVEGSGRAADILAYAHSKWSENKLKPVGLDELKQTPLDPLFKDEELWQRVADMIKKEFQMTDEKRIKKSVDQVRSCLNKMDHMTVFRLDGRSSAKDIDAMILKTMLKVNRGKRIDQLRLALAWNRVDVARNEIFKDGVVFTESELHDLMFAAIVDNRVDFVKFFLEKGVSLGKFLTLHRIFELYLHKVTSERCPKLKCSEKKPLELNHVGRLIKQLVGELFEPDYCKWQKQLSGLTVIDAISTTSPPNEDLRQSDDPARDLFLWSILTRNNDIAMVFWNEAKLLLSVFCPPLAPLLLKYRATERNQPSVTIELPSAKSSADNGRSQAREMHQTAYQGSATKTASPAVSSQSACRSSVRSYFVKLAYFFQAPEIKFSYSCLSYFAFLLLFSVILLTDFYPTIHVKEEILIAWVITILLEEIRQIIMDDARKFTLKLKNYITDIWNILDVITISTFIIGLILRFIPVSICAHCFYSARIILALNFTAFFFRILQMFSVHRELGPKLVMIGNMMIDLVYFMIILLVFIAAYGITSHAILYPNQPLNIALARDVFSRSWWNIFGDLGLEEVSGYECNETLTSEISAETCASLDYVEYDMAQCADYKDGKCPSIDWLVPIILSIYVLITNVLMLNLLIAMFSNTFDKIQGQSNVVWTMQYYNLLRGYDSRPMLPPPLIVLEHVYLVTRCVIRRYTPKCCLKHDCCHRGASIPRSSIRPSEEKELLNWENVNADEFLRKKELREQGSAENNAKKMNDRVDKILLTVEDIADKNFLHHSSEAGVQLQLHSLLEKRFEILEKQMNNTTQTLQWITDNMLREKLEKTMKLHRLARESIYPKSSDDKSQCYRTHVPDAYVPWEVHYPDYRPENFTDSSVRSTDFDPFRRENFNQASHQSWISGHNYSVVGGFPRNPKGRTGLRGRGILSSWGPNYVVNVVITRWKKGEQKLLEFVSVKKQAKDEQSIPEEETTYEETSRSSAIRKCFEKLFKNAESAEELLFPREREVYRGYLDDYRNTDNAWLETVVLNYHIEEKDDVKLLEIKDEEDINWKTIQSYIDAYGSHRLLLYRVAKSLGAAF